MYQGGNRCCCSLVLDKRQSSVRVGRPFIDLLFQSAFGEALPESSGHIGDVDAVVRFVVLQADAFTEPLCDLEKKNSLVDIRMSGNAHA
jgi:hypothetical protein